MRTNILPFTVVWTLHLLTNSTYYHEGAFTSRELYAFKDKTNRFKEVTQNAIDYIL